MHYDVGMTYLSMDRYGFLIRRKGSVRVDASSKPQAQKLAQDKCIVSSQRTVRIGRAELVAR